MNYIEKDIVDTKLDYEETPRDLQRELKINARLTNITYLLRVLAQHEREHKERPHFLVHTLDKIAVNGECLDCNQKFGVLPVC